MKSARTVIAIFVLSVFTLPAALAQAPLPDGMERITSVEGITEYRLENGLRVLLFPDPSKATITVNMTLLVGSVHEGYGETGMAHLLEHMVFKGSTRHEDIPKELQDHGAQFNGTTGYERTNYYETFDASDENLEWALDLEADRMMNSFILREDLDSEMTVVRNEFEASENNPLGVLFQRVLSTSYLWHGYGRPTIGSRADIENVPIPRLRAFYERYYQPDNAILVVAGRIDEDDTLEIIDEIYGSIPRPDRILEETYTEEPIQDGEREVVLRRVGDIQFLMAGYHAPHGTHPDFVPLQIASQILAFPPAGRLHQALVETGIAAQVGNTELQEKDPGIAILYAVVRAGSSIDEAREVFLQTIDDLADNPITAEEVDRTRNRLLTSIDQQMNSSQTIALQLSNWAAMGDWRVLFLDRDRVREVTSEDVQQAALKYYKPSNRTLGVFLPAPEPDRTEIPDRPDLVAMLDGYTGDEARSEGEAFDASPENVEARLERITLPGGTRLVMLQKETRGDVVTARISLNFGSVDSLSGMAMAGQIAGQMLMRGTTSHTRQEIQDEIASLQTQMNVFGGPDGTSASITSTYDNLPAVIQLAAEILREPSFPENEFNTLRDQALANMEFARSEPQVIVQQAFSRHNSRYDPDDVRYVATIDEEIEMTENLTLAELGDFHSAFYGASNAEVVVVGDFDPVAVRAAVEDFIDGWESPQTYAEVTYPYPEGGIEPIREVFETPDKENAFFMAGMPLDMSDEHPDYPAMVLGNYILGQGFNSRLISRIRGDEGLSYSVGSSFSAQAGINGGRFVVNAISAPQNATPVEVSFRDELATILEEGYTADEITAAKESWSQARQVSRAQDAALVGMLLSHEHNGRTMARDQELEAAIQALTGEDIVSAMRRHLDLDQMTFMMGGDFANATPDPE